jgi:outer membrane protein TolC
MRADPVVAAPFAQPAGTRTDPYGPRPPGTPRLSRDQIVRYALENPAVAAAQADIDTMNATLLQSKLAWVPVVKTTTLLAPGANIRCDDVTLTRHPSDPAYDPANNDTFDFQYCRPGTNEDLDINTIGGYFAQLGRAGIALEVRMDTVVPLTTFGKLRAARKTAEVAVALAGLEKERVRQETVVRVYEAHAALLLSRQSMKILREAWDVLADHRRKIVQDLGGGGFDVDPAEIDPDRDPDDLVELEVAEIEVASLMREAQKLEAVSLAALWAITGDAAPPGFDVRENEIAVDAIRGGLSPVEHYREVALLNRPEAKLAAAAVDLRRQQEKAARAAFLPDLGIAVGFRYGYGNASPPRIPALYYSRRLNYSNVTAALALSWDFDFHHDAMGLERARAQRRKAESQREAARRLLLLDVDRAYRDLVDARDDADFMQRARDKSWQLVVSQQQKQSVGGGEFRDLRRHLRSWAEFEFEHFEAIVAQNVALARLARAVGTPLVDPSPSGDR